MIDFGHARRVMVDNQLRTSGITDRRLIAALLEVPRERFVPEARRALAYIDSAIPVSPSRALGAPAPLARLMQLAEVDRDESVLVLGAGTGYSAALLARLAKRVVAIETDPALAGVARTALAELGADNVDVIEGDFYAAGKAKGPYDIILIEGAVEEVPETLFAQLKPEGRIVALVAEAGRPAVAHLFARSGKGIAAQRTFDAVLPPIQHEREDRFVF